PLDARPDRCLVWLYRRPNCLYLVRRDGHFFTPSIHLQRTEHRRGFVWQENDAPGATLFGDAPQPAFDASGDAGQVPESLAATLVRAAHVIRVPPTRAARRDRLQKCIDRRAEVGIRLV